MTTYEVRASNPKISRKLRLAFVLLYGGSFFVLSFAWSRWSAGHAEGAQRHTETALEVALTSVLFGLGMSFRPNRFPNYRLLVDEESLTSVAEYTGWMKWLKTRRTVHKGSVRSILTVPKMGGHAGGIGISERSKFGARMWGFVYVPESLPEFEDLRRLAESWRAP